MCGGVVGSGATRYESKKTVYGVVLNPAHHQQPRTPPNFPLLVATSPLLPLLHLLYVCLSIYLSTCPSPPPLKRNKMIIILQINIIIIIIFSYKISIILNLYIFFKFLCYSYCCYIYYNMQFNL